MDIPPGVFKLIVESVFPLRSGNDFVDYGDSLSYALGKKLSINLK